MPQPAPDPSVPPPDAIKTNRDLLATLVYDTARHEYDNLDETCAEYDRRVTAHDRAAGIGLLLAVSSITAGLIHVLTHDATVIAAEAVQKEGEEITKSAFNRLRHRGRGSAQPPDGPAKAAATPPPLTEWLAQDVRSITQDDAIRYRDGVYHAMLAEELSPRRAADISQRAYELLLRFPVAADQTTVRNPDEHGDDGNHGPASGAP